MDLMCSHLHLARLHNKNFPCFLSKHEQYYHHYIFLLNIIIFFNHFHQLLCFVYIVSLATFTQLFSTTSLFAKLNTQNGQGCVAYVLSLSWVIILIIINVIIIRILFHLLPLLTCTRFKHYISFVYAQLCKTRNNMTKGTAAQFGRL